MQARIVPISLDLFHQCCHHRLQKVNFRFGQSSQDIGVQLLNNSDEINLCIQTLEVGVGLTGADKDDGLAGDVRHGDGGANLVCIIFNLTYSPFI